MSNNVLNNIMIRICLHRTTVVDITAVDFFSYINDKLLIKYTKN